MARKRSQHYLTIAVGAPLTLIGVLYVVHLMRDDQGDDLWVEAWVEIVLSGMFWCLVWFILWITGTFKRWEKEQPEEG